MARADLNKKQLDFAIVDEVGESPVLDKSGNVVKPSKEKSKKSTSNKSQAKLSQKKSKRKRR